ncbi:MAG: hypothetical protein ACFE0Q_17750 [Anaerolineae bacterium]
MSWLQQRLKELGYTHQDLQAALEEKGIKRVRATITGWTNDKPISLMNDPEQARILADILDWSMLEMLIAAGYDVGVPPELAPFIDTYKEASPKQRNLFIQNLHFIRLFLSRLSEEELDEPDADEPLLME